MHVKLQSGAGHTAGFGPRYPQLFERMLGPFQRHPSNPPKPSTPSLPSRITPQLVLPPALVLRWSRKFLVASTSIQLILVPNQSSGLMHKISGLHQLHRLSLNADIYLPKRPDDAP
mmetsp:Transcript_16646/g.34163  ORF Transcript_16646/g.34163 Transcript_16646/m.34163 type:complete len:116 (-) Transcript_16646:3019-3366(-)